MSPWHEIPLYAGNGYLHYICEIPKETAAKMEVATVSKPGLPSTLRAVVPQRLAVRCIFSGMCGSVHVTPSGRAHDGVDGKLGLHLLSSHGEIRCSR